MNPKTKTLTIRPCIVCKYPFSDTHHIFPQRWGGVRTADLCPNHHRFANIIQVMLNNGSSDEFIQKFAERNFDSDFNRVALTPLIEGYKYLIAGSIVNLIFGQEVEDE